MRTLTAPHSKKTSDNELPYPYLRALLKFDTRETLNVMSLAFMEKEFSSELGMSQRQRIINILLEIIDGDQGVSCNTTKMTILVIESMFLAIATVWSSLQFHVSANHHAWSSRLICVSNENHQLHHIRLRLCNRFSSTH